MKSYPKISIITPSFNQAVFLEETIESILRQNYENIELIVMDGGSTDGSVEVIRRYEKQIAYWESRRDRGQAHAINNGIAHATGDIVAFLNSDDLYLPGSLHAVAHQFAREPESSWIAGGVLMFGERGCLDNPAWWHLAHIPHHPADWIYKNYEASQPAHFWRRDVFTRHGTFDEAYHYCFDHEFYIRLVLAGVRCRALHRPLAAYRFHGASKTVTAREKFEQEFASIAETYAGRISPLRAWLARRRATSRGKTDRMFHYFDEALASAQKGRHRSAWKHYLTGLSVCPTGIGSRASLGCGRRLLDSVMNRKSVI